MLMKPGSRPLSKNQEPMYLKLKIVSILLALSIVSFFSLAQEKVPLETGSVFSQQEAQEALNFNNSIRADVACAPLDWSVELAACAQEWAEYLISKGGRIITHNGEDQDGNALGENIYWITSSERPIRWCSAVEAVKSWYDEINDYDYQKNDTTNPKKEVGHYTQLVWRSTKKMGMGMAKNDWITIVVANYDPPGNWVGQKPY